MSVNGVKTLANGSHNLCRRGGVGRALKEQELESEAEKFARAVELEQAEVPSSASQGPSAQLQEQYNQLQQQVQQNHDEWDCQTAIMFFRSKPPIFM